MFGGFTISFQLFQSLTPPKFYIGYKTVEGRPGVSVGLVSVKLLSETNQCIPAKPEST